MSITDKAALYDWHGYNHIVFKWINLLYESPAYDALMLLLTHVFDTDHYPLFMLFFVFFALASAAIRRLRGKSYQSNGKHYLTVWVGVLAVLAVGFVLMAITVKTMKEDFAYPRPYVVFASDKIQILEPPEAGKDNLSFPSGHASFITFLIFGLWPALSRDMRVLGVLLIPAVCWSRIAVGMHFPADVVYGFVITAVIMIIARKITYWLLDALFGLKC